MLDINVISVNCEVVLKSTVI